MPRRTVCSPALAEGFKDGDGATSRITFESTYIYVSIYVKWASTLRPRKAEAREEKTEVGGPAAHYALGITAGAFYGMLKETRHAPGGAAFGAELWVWPISSDCRWPACRRGRSRRIRQPRTRSIWPRISSTVSAPRLSIPPFDGRCRGGRTAPPTSVALPAEFRG
jgi:hypothetical protein